MSLQTQTGAEEAKRIRLVSLLLDCGSSVLRRILTEHAQSEPDGFFHQKRTIIERLYAKNGVWNKAQFEQIFPPEGGFADIDTFDTSLLGSLLVNICKLRQPVKRDVIRLVNLQNEFYEHSSNAAFSENQFQSFWGRVLSVITNLSKSINEEDFENEVQGSINWLKSELETQHSEDKVEKKPQETDHKRIDPIIPERVSVNTRPKDSSPTRTDANNIEFLKDGSRATHTSTQNGTTEDQIVPSQVMTERDDPGIAVVPRENADENSESIVRRRSSSFDVLSEPVIDIKVIDPVLSAVIKDGKSLKGGPISSQMNPYHRVMVGIVVENWTKWKLDVPHITNLEGHMRQSPPVVQPGEREAMICHKVEQTATGTCGTVSWLLNMKGAARRAVITWSTPYSFASEPNWLGLGITRPGCTTPNRAWFDKIYRGNNSWGFSSIKSQFKDPSSGITYQDDVIKLHGNMGTSHQAVVSIVVKPIKEDDLAPSLRRERKEQRDE